MKTCHQSSQPIINPKEGWSPFILVPRLSPAAPQRPISGILEVLHVSPINWINLFWNEIILFHYRYNAVTQRGWPKETVL
jgi:hypothetical protein